MSKTPIHVRLITVLASAGFLLLIACNASPKTANPEQGAGGDVETATDISTSSDSAVTENDTAEISAGTDTASGIALDYAGETNLGACSPNASDPTRYATVGFWKSTDCSGEPVATNAFPINDTAGCYCWPGNSGENSADSFSCDADSASVTIVQYNSLTCGAGDTTPTTKTFYLDRCEQDMPPQLYAKVIDMGPCQ